MGNIPGKPFTDTLGELENGQLIDELTDKLYEVTQAVMETRKVGKVKIAFELKPVGNGTVAVSAKVDVNVPEHDRSSTSFFVGGDGALLRDDPSQERLPLREVPTANNEPINVAAGPANDPIEVGN